MGLPVYRRVSGRWLRAGCSGEKRKPGMLADDVWGPAVLLYESTAGRQHSSTANSLGLCDEAALLCTTLVFLDGNPQT